MPVYEYGCDCGKKQTHMQSISLPINQVRIVCSCGKDMKRVYSTPAVTFKGSGYYSTDKNK